MELLTVILYVYFVSFLDKPQQDAVALSPRAIEQRAKWGIENDELDYPVCQTYVDSIIHMGGKLFHTSRWMNGATYEMSEELAYRVEQLGFVTAIEATRDDSSPRYFGSPKRKIEMQPSGEITAAASMLTDGQLNTYNLLPLHEAGFEGQGILMAVCDGGFYNADQLTCFRQSELELGHFDFTDDTVGFYGITGEHGTMCLSTISAITDSYHGAATKAQYYLMRSEENDTESPKEMDNLIVALETADSLGVNVFSVSLGYAMFDNYSWDLSHRDLDGQTTRASRAATIAAQKGMLVCVAAGNEGSGTWKKISVPADADSILTVGAVNTSGTIGAFSSYGPSADGRIKPEVCAVGVQTTLINSSGSVVLRNGTSFATPLLAGLAASLWSALPSENAMQIRDRIIASADRVTNPDTKQYGYGIPDAWKAYTLWSEGTKEIKETTQPEVRKVLRGEDILIIRYGHVYNLAGQLLYSPL